MNQLTTMWGGKGTSARFLGGLCQPAMTSLARLLTISFVIGLGTGGNSLGATVVAPQPDPGPVSIPGQAESPFVVAQWIAPAAGRDGPRAWPVFRREFSADTQLQRATLRIIGLGDYDPSVNGTRLADTGINQPWSQYEKTIYYRDFDITALIQSGKNCVGVMLASSFWDNPNPPAGRYNKDGPQREASEPLLLCAEVILEQKDGTRTRVGTDASWRTTEGPIVFSHVYAGEDFDARRRLRRVGQTRDSTTPRGKQPASRQFRRRAWCGKTGRRSGLLSNTLPTSIEAPAPDAFLYSFPQNCSAQLRVGLSGGRPG